MHCIIKREFLNTKSVMRPMKNAMESAFRGKKSKCTNIIIMHYRFKSHTINFFSPWFCTYSEKCFRTSTLQSTIRYIGLFRKIGGVLDRRYHSFDRQKGRQIRSVRGDDNQREEPPYAAYYSRTSCLITRINFPSSSLE